VLLAFIYNHIKHFARSLSALQKSRKLSSKGNLWFLFALLFSAFFCIKILFGLFLLFLLGKNSCSLEINNTTYSFYFLFF